MHQNVVVCEVLHTCLLGYLRYGEKHAMYILISCGYNYVVVYKHVTQVSGVVSTWAKFDGHIYHGYPVTTQFSRLGIQGPASHVCLLFCSMLDTGFCGWFYFLSFFLLYILASML